MPEDRWPGGHHGLAMWFSGAPDVARLEVTEFWHPSLVEVCDNAKRSAVASAKRGDFRWNKRDKTTKALAHFTVTALAHLLRTEDAAHFGYSGPAIKTLYNAFKWRGNRSSAMKTIFREAGVSAAPDAYLGQPMEQMFIAVEGADNAPVVHMDDSFHDPSMGLKTVPIYVFWEVALAGHANWVLTPLVDVNRLENLADLIAESYGCSSPPGKVSEPDKPSVTDPDATLLAKQRFILLFLGLLHGDPTRSVPCCLTREFLPENVRKEVPQIAAATDVAELCERLGVVDETYRSIIRSLGCEWRNLKASLKFGVREYLTGSVLSDDLNHLPGLTAEDNENLQIRWDAADWEYSQVKRDALARCKASGFDASSQRIDLNRLEPVIDILTDLLQKKVEIDREHVRTAGARFSEENRVNIRERTGRAFSELQECLLKSMNRQHGEHVQHVISNAEKTLVGRSSPAVSIELGRYVRRFKSNWHDLESWI